MFAFALSTIGCAKIVSGRMQSLPVLLQPSGAIVIVSRSCGKFSPLGVKIKLVKKKIGFNSLKDKDILFVKLAEE